MPSQTCDLCHGIVDGQLADHGIRIEADDLEKSATRGACVLCSILFCGFQHCVVNKGRPTLETTSTNFPDEPKLCLFLWRKSTKPVVADIYRYNISDSTQNHWIRAEFFTLLNKPAPWSVFEPAQILWSSASIETCKQKLPGWLRACDQDHLKCQQPSQSFFPTRAINVGSASTDPFLFQSLGASAPYVALSHCWGQMRPLKTTQATLSKHLRQIEWNTLPATFQDAILVTRCLGVEFLWIDSLCIVQDDHDDWIQEAAMMTDVYCNSYLTIAALTAPDAHFGLFHNPEPTPATLETQAADIEGELFSIYSRRTVHFPKSGDRYPLLKRAWAFQELVVSPRVLLFKGAEIAWECNSKSWCCCLCDNDPTRTNKSYKVKWSHIIRAYSSTPSEQTNASSRLESLPTTMDSWEMAVEEYTKRHLTKLEDRLTALAGLARAFNRTVSSPYLAGLWQAHLVPGLLWYCPEDRPATQQLSIKADYRAPSWSWASVECSVVYCSYWLSDGEQELKVKILEARCTRLGVDPFGPVSDADIKIQGRLAELKYMYHQHQRNAFINRDDVAIQFYQDFNRLSPNPWCPQDGDTLYCLLIHAGETFDGSDLLYFFGLMLVLRSCARMIDGVACFERVGMCWRHNLAKSWFKEPQDLYLI